MSKLTVAQIEKYCEESNADDNLEDSLEFVEALDDEIDTFDYPYDYSQDDWLFEDDYYYESYDPYPMLDDDYF